MPSRNSAAKSICRPLRIELLDIIRIRAVHMLCNFGAEISERDHLRGARVGCDERLPPNVGVVSCVAYRCEDASEHFPLVDHVAVLLTVSKHEG